MTLNNIKAIFLDMDGTILHEDNKASLKQNQLLMNYEKRDIRYF